MPEPLCSVIVPSRNRGRLLERLLDALSAQTVGAERFEVLIVLDGCTDDSAIRLRDWQRRHASVRLRWQEQPRQGQAAARNAGAQLAQAPILAFLDDDVRPAPGWLAAHLQHYAAQGAVAVLGDYPMARSASDAWRQRRVWSWWEDAFFARAHAPQAYTAFCAGNVSLPREAFLRAGGFDAGFRGYGGEDYDLGYRLLKAGLRFVVEPRARAIHLHRSSPAQALRQARQEGRQDVRLARKHPELVRGLRLMADPSGHPDRIVRRIVFALPALAVLAGALVPALAALERLKLRGPWRWLFTRLRHVAYWRGVREAAGGWNALCALRRLAPPLPAATLAIDDGLPQRLPALWPHGPSELMVTHGGRLVGRVQLHPPFGAAPRPWLAEQLIEQLGPRLWPLLPARRPAGAPPGGTHAA